MKPVYYTIIYATVAHPIKGKTTKSIKKAFISMRLLDNHIDGATLLKHLVFDQLFYIHQKYYH